MVAAAGDEGANSSRSPRSPKEDVFSVVVDGQGFMAPAVAAIAPAPARCLSTYRRQRKKEGKGKKKGNGAADSAEELRAKERAPKGSSSFKVTSTH